MVPVKIRASKEVKRWLKTQDEFKLEDFSEPHTAYNRSWRLEQQHFMAAIEAVKDELPEEDREIAALFLLMPPRKIAVKLQISRKECYNRCKRAKSRAMRLYREKRLRAATRSGEVVQAAPIRTVTFSTPAGTAQARLVLREGEALWVDDKGQVFDEETRDLLDHLDELRGDFTVLDAEEE